MYTGTKTLTVVNKWSFGQHTLTHHLPPHTHINKHIKMASTSKNMLVLVFAAVAALSAVVINGQDYEDDSGNGLPGGSDDILSAPYDESFSCEGINFVKLMTPV